MANRVAFRSLSPFTDEIAWRLKSLTHRDDVYNESMPRIPPNVLDGVAYLFPSVDHANNRTQLGGTGFFVGREIAGSEDTPIGRAYAPYLITNEHVVSDGASVVSINRRDGNPPDVFDYNENDWTVHPASDDLAAICVFGDFKKAEHKTTFVSESKFLTEAAMQHFDVGVGDEVFMVGRFVNYQGRKINRPAGRFGNISMMLESIWIKKSRRWQEGFAVEMRSRTGFSGSPVAVYRTPATIISDDIPKEKWSFWALLGVNWGYVLDEDGENTFLNGVVPAWRITELLDTPALKEKQRMVEEDFYSMIGNNGPQLAYATDSKPPTTDENPQHKEDFSRLLTSVAKAKQSDDQT